MVKGQFVQPLLAVLVGVILVFSVTIPIIYNGVYGVEYLDDAVSNNTVLGNTEQYFVVDDCIPIRTDTTWLTVTNQTGGQDYTSEFAVGDATTGNLTWTNTSVHTGAFTFEFDYRCTGDAGYITGGTSRNVTSFLAPLIVVLILVGLASLMVLRK